MIMITPHADGPWVPSIDIAHLMSGNRERWSSDKLSVSHPEPPFSEVIQWHQPWQVLRQSGAMREGGVFPSYSRLSKLFEHLTASNVKSEIADSGFSSVRSTCLLTQERLDADNLHASPPHPAPDTDTLQQWRDGHESCHSNILLAKLRQEMVNFTNPTTVNRMSHCPLLTWIACLYRILV